MVILESWIIIGFYEVMKIIFTYFSFISEGISLERVILVQNLTTWIKFTLAPIYNQLSFIDYTQQMMHFESWTRVVIDKYLL